MKLVRLALTAWLLAAPLNAQPQPASPPSAAFYSPDGDPAFAEPYIDKDEWRDAPVRHRYIHGGFKGTETRFSFYFPPKEKYQARFFQLNTPVPDDENLAQKAPRGPDNWIGFSVDSGAYFVETNGGGKFDLGKVATMKYDPTISAYRANAASAAYSRVVAQKMYGGKRPFGYGFGGSGGAFRTIGSFENTRGVWDGVVPFVMGSNMAIPNMFTVRIRAMRIIGDKFPQIVDAASPGGSGDIYAGLTPLEAEALREVTRMGFEPQAWFGYKTMGIHGLAALYPGVLVADPSYFTDFWTKPGYLGHDHPEQFEGARLQFASTIGTVMTAADAARQRIRLEVAREGERGGVDTAFLIPEGAAGQRIVALRLAETPPAVPFLGGDLIVKSGAAAGRRLPVARIVGDVIVFGTVDSSVAAQLRAGDAVQVDNSGFLALETYHRHQVPDASYKVWDQFRNADGTPKYPQRPALIGPGFVRNTGGSILTGKWTGKMIVVESLWDREAMPWSADWYRGLVTQHLGARTDAHFRVWMTDHALHGGVEDPSRIVSYVPVLQQALRDVATWVENGTPPPASTNYKVVDGQVVVPPDAADRQGIQPTVILRANGGQRAEVKVGEAVSFAGMIAVPPGTGTLIAAKWDVLGKGAFDAASPVPNGARSATVSYRHSFEKQGTYFVGLKAISQRRGDIKTPFARVENIGRVRVVVK